MFTTVSNTFLPPGSFGITATFLGLIDELFTELLFSSATVVELATLGTYTKNYLINIITVVVVEHVIFNLNKGRNTCLLC